MSQTPGLSTASARLALAQRTLGIEAQALLDLQARLSGPAGEAFDQAVGLMLNVRGRVVVMGMGKSGHVARKITATLASTGTPAMFVHPAEASHGDLGMIKAVDLVLALSNNGESDELVVLLPALKRLGVPLVAITGRANSTLAQHATVVLDSAVAQEACPLNLAPTASTTAQLALGDALAVVLLEARGFSEQDFARSHPGGALGRKLLTHVRDVMRKPDEVPQVPADADFSHTMREMSRKALGATAVVDAAGKLLGVFTDGDLRRKIEAGADLRTLNASQLMTALPKTIGQDALAAEAAEMMERHRVTTIFVVDDSRKLVSVLNSNDLMQAKVI
jgi:arabinose-5-phosphate isomerase